MRIETVAAIIGVLLVFTGLGFIVYTINNYEPTASLSVPLKVGILCPLLFGFMLIMVSRE